MRNYRKLAEKGIGGYGICTDVDGCARMKDAYGSEWDALHLEIVDTTNYLTLFKVPEILQKRP